MFRWAIDRELVTVDPTEVSKRSKYEARDRALSADELKLFWAGCDRLGWPFGRICQLLLLTGQREGEVGGMRWDEIDPVARVWTIPGRRTKNGKAHVVHLSEAAAEVIEGLPRLTGELVFASGAAPPSGYSKAKARLDGYMGELPHWVLHDLRRTAATGMARLGIAPHVVDRILNHTAGTIRGVAAIYNRFEYEKEREAALEAWGRYVVSLVRPGDDNVIGLRRA
jgi:integrase